MNRMIPAGWDDSLCEGWIPLESGMDGPGENTLRCPSEFHGVKMISAGLDGKDKRDEWMDAFGGMNRMIVGFSYSDSRKMSALISLPRN